MTFKILDNDFNQYLAGGMTLEWCEEQADKLGYRDDFDAPVISVWGDHYIWSDHLLAGGTKQRWGDLLFRWYARHGVEEVVYVAPRQGFAGIAVALLAKRYGLRCTLFMPSSKAVSDHQLVAIEAGARPVFRRVAAMPNLNREALRYAESLERGAFVPFGMNDPLVVVAGVVSTRRWSERLNFWPKFVATVVSTGVLTRVLQIAWPQAHFSGLAVARNMHDGETGRAWMHTYDRAFTQKAHRSAAQLGVPRHISSERHYDLKALDYFQDADSTTFWNVAGDVWPMEPERRLEIDSFREWGEVR
jgi:hypothetical protein